MIRRKEHLVAKLPDGRFPVSVGKNERAKPNITKKNRASLVEGYT